MIIKVKTIALQLKKFVDNLLDEIKRPQII